MRAESTDTTKPPEDLVAIVGPRGSPSMTLPASIPLHQVRPLIALTLRNLPVLPGKSFSQPQYSPSHVEPSYRTFTSKYYCRPNPFTGTKYLCHCARGSPPETSLIYPDSYKVLSSSFCFGREDALIELNSFFEKAWFTKWLYIIVHRWRADTVFCNRYRRSR
jgi:hypothetical protein